MVPPFKSDDADKKAQREIPSPSDGEKKEGFVPHAAPPPVKDTGQKHETQSMYVIGSLVDPSLFLLADDENRTAIGPFGGF